MADDAIAPPAGKPAASSPRPVWRRLLVGLLAAVAVGSALLFGVACYFAVMIATDDTPAEGYGRSFAFAYVLFVLAGAAATLILSAGGAWLLSRRPRATSERTAPLRAWSPLRVAITVLVLILLLRVSFFGLSLLFGLGGNQVFLIFSDVLQWATLLGPLVAVLLVLGLRGRTGRVS